jgi:hypothetical protein
VFEAAKLVIYDERLKVLAIRNPVEVVFTTFTIKSINQKP